MIQWQSETALGVYTVLCSRKRWNGENGKGSVVKEKVQGLIGCGCKCMQSKALVITNKTLITRRLLHRLRCCFKRFVNRVILPKNETYSATRLLDRICGYSKKFINRLILPVVIAIAYVPTSYPHLSLRPPLLDLQANGR
jgi:hypothetical protein